eukprot:gene11569-11713_t
MPAAGTVAAATLTTVYPSFMPPVAVVFVILLSVAAVGRIFSKKTDGSKACINAEQVLQLVRTRRSVYPKDYTGLNDAITNDKLEMMLEAARWAPTHKLTEPWHFVVLAGASKAEFEELTIDRCQALLPPDKAEQVVAKLRRKQSKDWPKVHCYIAICMQRHDEVPEWEEVAAVACAVQNMQLVGTALGVAGYWSSWQAVARDSSEMHQLLGIDGSKGDRCLGVVVVGQSDEQRLGAYKPRRQPLNDKVVWRY